MILAGDVGATKILLEVGESRSDRWEPAFQRRYPLADFDNLSAVLARFVEEWKAARPKDPALTAACFGAAGPAVDNRIKMTHRAWIIDGAHIAHDLGIQKATVVNDLHAAASGIPWLPASDMVTLQAGAMVKSAPQVVLGVGTGLGIAYIVDGVVLPGEGGHAGFSPASAEQHAVWSALISTRPRVEQEEVASGMGLANIHFAITGRHAQPAEISERAERGDSECRNVLEIFAECLGNVAGDHALATMARGGVFLGGGVIAKIAPLLHFSRFSSAFCSKGALSSMLMEIPVRVITNENLAVIGAARIASRGR